MAGEVSSCTDVEGCSGLSDREKRFHCEWMKAAPNGKADECGTVFTSIQSFQTHVREHVLMDSQMGMLGNCGEKAEHVCLWKDCGWRCEKRMAFLVHTLYHPFHAQLKFLGARVLEKKGLPICSLGSESHNILPEFIDEFHCCWKDCTRRFEAAHDFYVHVESHCRWDSMVDSSDKKSYKCEWTGCEFSGKTFHKLLEHTHVHTQKKQAACPTCGCLFASNTKLADHVTRQGEGKLSCMYCGKCFTTKRILNSHVSSHINKYKCPHCEMTVPNKSALENHILWKHSNRRSFVCELCQKTFKTEAVLKRHIETHSDLLIDCAFPDCDFIASSEAQYKIHIEGHLHSQQESVMEYCCNECSSLFPSGSLLTKHLKTQHGYLPLPGHTRFRYMKCPDGLKRLQTVRFEAESLTIAKK